MHLGFVQYIAQGFLEYLEMGIVFALRQHESDIEALDLSLVALLVHLFVVREVA